MLIKLIFVFLINVLVCKAFYPPSYPSMPFPMPYPSMSYSPINPYGMMPAYGPYMHNSYQGLPIGMPDIIDLPASEENNDEIVIQEEINPKLTENNATATNLTKNITEPITEKNENKTSVQTPIKTEPKKENPDIPYPTKIDGPPGKFPFNDPYGGIPYGGIPFSGLPFGGMPYSGMPYYGMPYNGMPYGGAPYGGSPYGGSPYGGAPYGGVPYDGAPYGSPQTRIPNPPSDSNTETKKPLLDPKHPPYAYSPTPTFKVIKQDTGESIKEVVRGPVKSSTLTVSEPSKTVITRTIDPKTGEALVSVNTNSKDNKENNDLSALTAVKKSTTRRPYTFRARTK